MKIKKSRDDKIDEFYILWELAIAYHKKNNYPVFPIFPKETIASEIKEGLHYSVYTENNELIGYFSLALEDYIIWEELEKGDAIYIHRMCVNRKFRTYNLSQIVLSWAYQYVKEAKRRYVRMDTWGDNKQLVKHYTSAGFQFKKYRKLGNIPELASHYDGILLIMFENDVEDKRLYNA